MHFFIELKDSLSLQLIEISYKSELLQCHKLVLNLLDWKKETESEVAQSCVTLCDPMECSLPVSSVHGIFQARVLEWVAISFSQGSSRPRDQAHVSHIAGGHFTIWATRDAIIRLKYLCIYASLYSYTMKVYMKVKGNELWFTSIFI